MTDSRGRPNSSHTEPCPTTAPDPADTLIGLLTRPASKPEKRGGPQVARVLDDVVEAVLKLVRRGKGPTAHEIWLEVRSSLKTTVEPKVASAIAGLVAQGSIQAQRIRGAARYYSRDSK